MKPLFRIAVLFALVAPAFAQTPVNMKVLLRNEDGTPMRLDKGDSLQIRVRVTDESGGSPKEGAPNTSGEIEFTVTGTWPTRNGPTPVSYRVRVISSEFEEVELTDIVPARGDRIVTIPLKRKAREGEAPAVKSGTGAMVSLSELKVPEKARKELDKGNAALQANDLPTAGGHFAKAIEFYPDYDQAYNNLGVVMMQRGDTQGARENFQKAAQLNDHFARAFTNLGKLAMADKKYAEAEQHFNKSLQNDPLNPDTLFFAAEAAYLQHHFEPCVTYVRVLHNQAHDRYAIAHYMAGQALEQLNRGKEAADEYRLFLREDPNSPRAAQAQAALNALGRPQ